jgi:hypothetical protein
MKKGIKISIILIVLILVIVFGMYFNKYRIISNYQKKVLDVLKSDNYSMELKQENENVSNIFVKNNITVISDNNIYIIIDNNTNKQYFVSNTIENKVKEMSDEEKIKVQPSIFSNCGIIDDSSIFSLIKADSKMKLSSLEYNNKKCYKIETDSSNTKSEFTVIFDKETKLPVAIQNGKDSKVYNVKVEIGNVQDSDVSVDDIVNKLK